jgi:plastocyanin
MARTACCHARSRLGRAVTCAAAAAVLSAPAAAAEPAPTTPAPAPQPAPEPGAAPSPPGPEVAIQLDAPPTARVGQPVQLEVHAVPAGTAVVYRWDWTGTGGYGEGTTSSRATHVFEHAGRFMVGVTAAATGGEPVQAHVAILVSPPPRPRAISHPRRRAGRARAAGTAGDPSVTIRDFSFEAPTVTVREGEGVTWVNQGPSRHTATGTGFNTGILAPGQSSTITFSHAGTFSYRCSIHPFMHGVVVVTAAGSSSSGSSVQAPAEPAAPAVEAQPPGPRSLPATGLDLLPQLLGGLAAIVLGALLWAAASDRARG